MHVDHALCCQNPNEGSTTITSCAMVVYVCLYNVYIQRLVYFAAVKFAISSYCIPHVFNMLFSSMSDTNNQHTTVNMILLGVISFSQRPSAYLCSYL